MHRSCELSQR